MVATINNDRKHEIQRIASRIALVAGLICMGWGVQAENSILSLFGFVSMFLYHQLARTAMEVVQGQDIWDDAISLITLRINGELPEGQWDSLLGRGMNGDVRYIEMQRKLALITDHFHHGEWSNSPEEPEKDALEKVRELLSSKGWTYIQIRDLQVP